jgi:KDO2-lipid IV(A) lauroyltransferase
LIRPDQWQNQEDPLRWITQSYTAAIEEIVRDDPEQYLWIHRRWKSKPRTARKKQSETAQHGHVEFRTAKSEL